MQGFSGFRLAYDSKGAILPPDWDMQDPDFPTRKLAGQTYQNATFHKSMIFGFNFKGSTFSPGTNFSYSCAGGADFSHCQVRAANFTKAILTGADFTETDLRGAIFDNALLAVPKNMPEFLQKLSTEYGMSRPIIWLLELQEESRKKDSPGSREDLPPFSNSFEGANLAGASFKGADIRKRDFRKANLAYTDFTNAQMQEADLTGARIVGAKFDGANLDGAKINLEEAVEQVRHIDNDKAIQAYIDLGNFLFDNRIELLGIQNPETAKQVKEILGAKAQNLITSSEIKEIFINSLNLAAKRGLKDAETLPFVFEQIHKIIAKKTFGELMKYLALASFDLAKISIDNGLFNKKTAKQLQEIFEAKAQKKITQHELNEAFKTFDKEAHQKGISTPDIIPFIIEQTYQKLLIKLGRESQ